MNRGLVFWTPMVGCLFFVACAESPPAEPSADLGAQKAPAAVSGFTSGEISRRDPVLVTLVEPAVSQEQLYSPLEPSPLTFEPAIAGVALWVATNELQFRPSDDLEPGQRYQASFDLGKSASESQRPGPSPGEKPFEFTFRVREQAFAHQVLGLVTDRSDERRFDLRGRITTNDWAPAAGVEAMLTSEPEGRGTIWTHASNGQRHDFVIRGLRRAAADATVTLTFAGSSIGVDETITAPVTLPGKGAFAAFAAKAVSEQETFIEVTFSDPLDPKQDLAGLIVVPGKSPRYRIEQNRVRLFASKWDQEQRVVVKPGVRDKAGNAISTEKSFAVTFEVAKPQVRFVGNGVILPAGDQIALPLEVARLRAVDVEALKVADQNVPQFLQVNDLAGTRELARVGRVVWRQEVPLNIVPQDRRRWTRVGLDLSPLLAQDPFGLYRLKVSFRPQQVDYFCPQGGAPAVGLLTVPGDSEAGFVSQDSEASAWDGIEASYSERYRNRNDPCHLAYYGKIGDHNIAVSRNVLVSNLGLIAKQGSDGTMVVVVTDLKTAEPRRDVEVSLLDYQQTTIVSGKSDGAGMVNLRPSRRPFLLMAEAEGQKAYLRLQDGASLAVSHFDVGGQAVNRGLKGFFYGERGVWRPGDDIFLTFVLFDPEDRLPAGHPVKFELRGADARLVDAQTTTRGIHGFYRFATGTGRDAATGDYVATAKVGGATFEKTLKIETVVPNRLKIDLNLGDPRLQGPKAKIRGKLAARWLHGAVAPDLDVDVAASLVAVPTVFDRFTDYAFDDPTREFAGTSETLFEGTLDSRGRATFTADLGPITAPGMLSANVRTRVFEPGGGFSVDGHTVPFSPYKRYVGIKTPKGDKARGMLLTDKKHSVRLVMVDADGRAKGNSELQVQLYKIKWRWWWAKGAESLPDYAGSSSYTPIAKGKVKLKGGRGQWQFTIKHPEWGRYLLLAWDKKGGHRAGKIVYIDWPGWAGRAQKDRPGAANVLMVTADQATYQVGDTATLTIPATSAGRALVSIESGTRVVAAEWVEVSGEQTQHPITLTPVMTPNVFAHVTLLQPHQQQENDLPLRLYGVVPISVVDPTTQLAPKLACADVFEPNSAATVTVSEGEGRAMGYTVAVVDEGLLGLTRYRTPDPGKHFYGRNALGVRSWDLFDSVAGGFRGKLDRLLAIGGGYEDEYDEEAADERERSANRFPPVVRFLGPFALAAGEKAEHKIDIPQYIGAVRVMAVAGGERAFGAAKKSVFVRKPLMVLGALPRVLGPEEQVELPVSVFVMEGGPKKVEVSVLAGGPLAVVGEKGPRRLKFAGPGDKLVGFKLAAGRRLGVGQVEIKAAGEGQRAAHTIEIDVRYPGKRVTDILAATVAPGKSWEAKTKLAGLAGSQHVALEISSVPPVNLEQRLDYLIRFPHGCVEQTVSAAFPQLFLSDLVGLSKEQEADVQTHVNAALDRLRVFQQASGGFAMWPANGPTHPWATTYAGHFILAAKERGFLIPPGVLSLWQRHQKDETQTGVIKGGRAALLQAYRLFTLALSGKPQLAAMNRLKESGELDVASSWRLAAAYQLAGQKETAAKLSHKQNKTVKTYRELGNTFGSQVRDQAMILETLVLLADGAGAGEVARGLSQSLNSETWLSTQDTAYALLAMARYARAFAPASSLAVSYTPAGGKATRLTTDKPIGRVAIPITKGRRFGLTVANEGKGAVFANLLISSLPKLGKEKAAARGLDIEVEYGRPRDTFAAPSRGGGDDYYDGYDDYDDYDDHGGEEAATDGQIEELVELDPTEVEQGTDILMRVTVRHTGKRRRYRQLVLSHFVPSGWEIHNRRLFGAGDTGLYEYQDVRDDRVYTYFSLERGEQRVFELRANAAYPGKFYLPMVTVEAMYDASIQARTAGFWARVLEPDISG